MNGVTAMDENGDEIKSPIKRLGSTRKLLVFNSKFNFSLLINKFFRIIYVNYFTEIIKPHNFREFFFIVFVFF